MQRVQRLPDARNQARGFREQRRIERVACRLQRVDPGTSDSPRLGEVPRAGAAHEKEIAVIDFGQLDVNRRQHLPRGFEVEMFGVDEDAVVVPEDGFDHSMTTARRPSTRRPMPSATVAFWSAPYATRR